MKKNSVDLLKNKLCLNLQQCQKFSHFKYLLLSHTLFNLIIITFNISSINKVYGNIHTAQSLVTLQEFKNRQNEKIKDSSNNFSCKATDYKLIIPHNRNELVAIMGAYQIFDLILTNEDLNNFEDLGLLISPHDRVQLVHRKYFKIFTTKISNSDFNQDQDQYQTFTLSNGLDISIKKSKQNRSIANFLNLNSNLNSNDNDQILKGNLELYCLDSKDKNLSAIFYKF